MSALGIEQVTTEPDFYLGQQLILDDGATYETVNSYWGSGWNYGTLGQMYAPGGDLTTNRNREIDYRVGTLIIDIFEADARELVWRGVAEEHVEPDDDPAQRQRKADEAVREILQRFAAAR